MIEIKRPTQKQIVVIRSATGNELSNYEKRKLAGIESGAQVNTIEVIKINGQRLQIDKLNKEVNIDLGVLADKDAVTPKEISPDELFFIKCTLEEDLGTKGEN
jgi:predicted metalloprotease with PDZ domain